MPRFAVRAARSQGQDRALDRNYNQILNVRISKTEKHRLTQLAMRQAVPVSAIVRRRLFGRTLDPFFTETLRSIATEVRSIRFTGGSHSITALIRLESRIVGLILAYNGVGGDH